MRIGMKWMRWFWGIFFLISAGVLLAVQVGWLGYTTSVWTIVATILLVIILIKSLAFFSVFGVTFSLALMSMLFAKPLGITHLVPWTILGIALLVSIGLGLILQPLRRRFFRRHAYGMANRWAQHHHRHGTIPFQNESETVTDHEADVNVNMRFGNTVRYVQSDHFEQADIDISMGQAKVYFDQAQIANGQATIILNGRMAGVDLYIPKDWDVNIEMDTYLINLQEKGVTPTKTGPKVLITGGLRMSDLNIYYLESNTKSATDGDQAGA